MAVGIIGNLSVSSINSCRKYSASYQGYRHYQRSYAFLLYQYTLIPFSLKRYKVKVNLISIIWKYLIISSK